MVRPWNESLKARKRNLPPATVLPHLRVNLRAASQASVPELQKNTRSAKEFSTNSFDSRVEGTVW